MSLSKYVSNDQQREVLVANLRELEIQVIQHNTIIEGLSVLEDDSEAQVEVEARRLELRRLLAKYSAFEQALESIED